MNMQTTAPLDLDILDPADHPAPEVEAQLARLYCPVYSGDPAGERRVLGFKDILAYPDPVVWFPDLFRHGELAALKVILGEAFISKIVFKFYREDACDYARLAEAASCPPSIVVFRLKDDECVGSPWPLPRGALSSCEPMETEGDDHIIMFGELEDEALDSLNSMESMESLNNWLRPVAVAS
jgi:hypothetical protein